MKNRVVIKVIYKDVAEPIDLKKVPFIYLQERMRHGKFSKEIVKYVEQIEDSQYIYLVYDEINRGDVATFMKERKILFLTETELKTPVRSIMKAV